MFQIGSYQVQEKLFESSNTLVYRAKNTLESESDDTTFILKQLKHQYPTPEQLARFRKEFEVSKKLGGKGVLKAHKLLRHENSLVMVLEDINGESVANLYQDKAMRIPEFLRFALKLVDCIDTVHQNKVIHKDINPSNIIMDKKTQRLKVIDFGISSELEYEEASAVANAVFKGTFAYISPEQTGRMNQGVDYRTDFYSLGVTFYQLLTGKLPFEADDPMEWVHAHIAKLPISPDIVNETIPPTIAKIVLKLLAKNVDDRYSTLFGLKRDLEQCRREFSSFGKISDFALGSADYSGQFNISKQLVGRENEVKALLEAYDEIGLGNKEIVTISGASGIGKTSLIHEIKKPVLLKSGYYLESKFEQFGRTVPYSAIISVVRSLIQQILSETDSSITRWKKLFKESMHGFEHILIEQIPELKYVLEEPTSETVIKNTELDNKFSETFKKLFAGMCKSQRPIVIFFDDMQWADLSSLELIKALATDKKMEKLMLIMAYRDNEVSAAHPFIQTLNELSSEGVYWIDIELAPLTVDDTNKLLSNSMRMDEQTCRPLASLCHNKTLGNPFYLNQFVLSLHDKNEIVFNKDSYHWSWDLTRIKQIESADNVIDLVVGKLSKLGDEALKLLQIASVMGNQFELGTLVSISERTLAQVAENLFEALQLGLISPLNDSYKWAQFLEVDDVSEYQELVNSQKPRYRFVHDRVQQAAYQIVSDTQRLEYHLTIGKSLLFSLNSKELNDRVFETVNHLNSVDILSVEPALRLQVAELNLMAATKAKSSAAYHQAEDYIQKSLQLLENEDWTNVADLAAKVHIEAAELSCIAAEYEKMDVFLGELLLHNKSVIHQLLAAELELIALIAQHKSAEAVAKGVDTLSLIDIHLPKQPNEEDVFGVITNTVELLTDVTPTELLAQSTISDEKIAIAMRVLNQICSPSYQSNPLLFPIVVCNLVQLTRQHGNTSASCFAFATYGLLLNGMLGKTAEATEMTEFAIKLVHQLNVPEVECMTQYVSTTFVEVWTQPIPDTVSQLRHNYQLGIMRGDNEYACWSAMMEIVHAFYCGHNLETLKAQTITYLQMMHEIKQETASIHMSVFAQLLELLLDPSASKASFSGTFYDESVGKQVHEQANDNTALGILGMVKIHLAFNQNEYATVVRLCAETLPFLGGLVSSIYIPNYHFMHGVAHCLLASEALTTTEISDHKQAAAAELEQLSKWTRLDSEKCNFKAKYHLLNAEFKRISEAFSLDLINEYERAISTAQITGFNNEEALANEYFGYFWLQLSKIDIAQIYLRRAEYLFDLTGNKNKLAKFKYDHAQILEVPVSRPTTDIVNRPQTMGTADITNLDLSSVMKASQAISKEIVREKLLQKMMILVLENAGAQTGKLILDVQQNWKIVADADISTGAVDLNEQGTINLADDIRLPVTVVQYVYRTREVVVLSEESIDERFPTDLYLIKHKPKSVLCMPILHRGHVDGFLYLENNVLVNAFTPERLEIVKLLASQTVISLENADLYKELEQRVQERTKSLNEANAKLTKLATIDSLSGASTRRHFLEQADLELTRAIRSQRPLVAMMLDIDHFKSINDNYGHAAGDEAIKTVVGLCKETLRPTDVFGRLGGEEFAIILPESELMVGHRVADRIRQSVEKQLIEHQDNQFSVRVSVGIAQFRHDDTTIEQLLHVADRALYQAKRNGRNLVVTDEELEE